MKKYVLIAGVNGAGKSTLYHILDDLQGMRRINTDEIVSSFGYWNNPEDVIKAGKIAVSLIRKYFEDGESFNQETTLCGKSILRNIEIAKEKGYIIELHYVGVNSVTIAKNRIQQRVLNGGHDIPDKDVERRYEESIRNLSKIISKCDKITFYDNTEYFERIAFYQDNKINLISNNIPIWMNKLLSNE